MQTNMVAKSLIIRNTKGDFIYKRFCQKYSRKLQMKGSFPRFGAFRVYSASRGFVKSNTYS